jgi:dolichol-phosphate mannosyltransferase
VAGLLSLVIPVYNEQESLGPLRSEIDAVSQSLGQRIEIVFVDDGSTDGSWATISELAKVDPRVRGLRFRRNFGKAAALEAGFRAAAGDIVMTLDADLQDDPQEIPRFLAAIRGGSDVVSGYKQIRHDPWHKVFPSRIFNAMVSWTTGVKLHDHNCGFKAYRAEVIREVRLYGELHRYVPVLAAARGFKVSELVVNHRPRKFGHSKFGAKRFLKGFLDLIQVKFVTAFGWRPMHFLGTLAFFAFLFAGLGLAILAFNGLLRWIVDSQWGIGPLPQILGFITVVGLVLFGTQAVLAGYLAELLASRRTDEPFTISETTP